MPPSNPHAALDCIDGAVMEAVMMTVMMTINNDDYNVDGMAVLGKGWYSGGASWWVK